MSHAQEKGEPSNRWTLRFPKRERRPGTWGGGDGAPGGGGAAAWRQRGQARLTIYDRAVGRLAGPEELRAAPYAT